MNSTKPWTLILHHTGFDNGEGFSLGTVSYSPNDKILLLPYAVNTIEVRIGFTFLIVTWSCINILYEDDLSHVKETAYNITFIHSFLGFQLRSTSGGHPSVSFVLIFASRIGIFFALGLQFSCDLQLNAVCYTFPAFFAPAGWHNFLFCLDQHCQTWSHGSWTLFYK